MTTVSSVLKTVKEGLAKKFGITIEDYVAEIDFLQTGLLSDAQFNMLLQETGVRIEHGAMDALHQRYGTPKGIDALKLIKEIFEVEIDVQISAADCMKALNDLSRELKVRQIDIIYALRPYDQDRIGFIPKEDFIYAIGHSAAAEAVAHIYSDANGKVNVRRVLDALRNAIRYRKPDESAPKAVAQIALELLHRHVPYMAILFRFDRYHTGFVSIHDFTGFLQNSGIAASPKEVEDCAFYFSKDDKIDIVSFFEAIQWHDEQEKLRRRRPAVGVNIQAALGALGQNIGSDPMKVFPSSPNNLIPRATFIQCISKVARLQEPELEAVADLFAVGTNDVDFVGFVRLFMPTREEEEYRRHMELICRLRHDAQGRTALLREHFARADPSGQRTIPASMLKPALNQSGIQCSVAEEKDVQRYFQAGVNEFDYVLFLKYIE